MTSLDPLKTVISIGNVDDTSLALPSVNQLRSGQQRVREQVQTVRRTRSRQSSTRSGSTSLSPTSKSSCAAAGRWDVCSRFQLFCWFSFWVYSVFVLQRRSHFQKLCFNVSVGVYCVPDDFTGVLMEISRFCAQL